MVVTCPVCLDEFVPTRSDSVYCQPACRQKAYRWRVTDKPLPVTQIKRPESVIRSRSSTVVIRQILDLHFPTAATAVDATWGRGVFWKGIDQVKVIGCDLVKAKARDVVAECGHLPFKDKSFDVGVIDLPFMHDIRPHNGTGLYDCYQGVGTWKRVVNLTVAGAHELQRVCRQGYIIKGKNGIESGKYRHVEAALIAALGPPYDRAILDPIVALPNDPKWGPAQHFRCKDSFFLVYKWPNRKGAYCASISG